MWMIRWFFIAIVVLVFGLFIGNNKGHEPITIDYVFGITEEMSPLLAIFYAFIAGFLTWFIVSIFNFFKMRNSLVAKDKVIKNLKKELNSYRNASLNALDGAEQTMVMSTKEDSEEESLTEEGEEEEK